MNGLLSSRSSRIEKTATDTALVECVDGKPYSRAADPDMVILVSGGDSGRGKHNRSLTKPLKYTPAARIIAILVESARVKQAYATLTIDLETDCHTRTILAAQP